MTLPSYDELPPQVGESAPNYCSRLQNDGFEEMFIRKALRFHFNMKIEDFGSFFNEFEQARLRHITMLSQINPKRSKFSLAKKVAKNLGISETLAELWVMRFEEVGKVPFVGMTDP